MIGFMTRAIGSIGARAMARAPHLLVLIALGGCAGDPGGGVGAGPREAGGAPLVREVAPGLLVLSSTAPSGRVDGRDLQPRAGETTEWRVLATGGSALGAPGETITVRATDLSRHHAALAVDEGGEQVFHIDGAALGEPALRATDTRSERSISHFDPPLLLGRATIAPGETIEASSAMRIDALEPPHRERDHGTATRRIRYVADEMVRTALGDMPCLRVETEFVADLQFARATVTTIRWIVPDVGAVAEEKKERIVVLGLIPRDSRRVAVRTTPIAARREAPEGKVPS